MTAEKGKILLVDDEQMIRRLLEQKLSAEGYNCEQAANAEQALEKLLEFVIEFDAIRQLAIVKSTSECDAETDLIVERLHATFPEIEVPVVSYGPVLASHIGPDTMGIIVHESYET